MDRRRRIETLLGLLARLPLPLVHGLGTLVGWGLWLLPNEQRTTAAINLRLCFPGLSDRDRRRLLRRALVHNARGMLELGPLWLWDARRILRLIRRVEGDTALRQALARGQGVIAVTPHLGAWEMAGLYFSSLVPLTTLYRPNRQGIDPLIRRGREKLGARTVPTDQRGVRALMQALKGGGAVGILPDQDPGRDNGLFAPFFGVPANTMVLLSRLAIKSGAPVIMVTARRLSRGGGFDLHIQPLPEAVNREPLEASVAAVNQAVEQAVRRMPEQYLWSYRRFKTRPDGEGRLYPKRRR